MRYAPVLVLLACRGAAHDPGPPPTAIAHRDAAAIDAPAPDAPCDGTPVALGDGISAERWRVTATDEACLDLVRVDLSTHALRILAAAREQGGARPAPRWVDDFGLAA